MQLKNYIGLAAILASLSCKNKEFEYEIKTFSWGIIEVYKDNSKTLSFEDQSSTEKIKDHNGNEFSREKFGDLELSSLGSKGIYELCNENGDFINSRALRGIADNVSYHRNGITYIFTLSNTESEEPCDPDITVLTNICTRIINNCSKEGR
ncbi:hypothetical protein J4440_00725 [Candidatus Woesearchaeota archaeon]|nr:hypothetical protein [Candidatus Woesearchaeota archaeon]